MTKEYIWVQVKVGTSTNGSDVLEIAERLEVRPGQNGWVTLYEEGSPFPETNARGLAEAVTKFIHQKAVDIYAVRQNTMGGTPKESGRPTYTIHEEKA